MPKLCAHAYRLSRKVVGLLAIPLFVVLVALAVPARAEISTVSIARQLSMAFLPTMVMEDQKLLEKHLAAAGLGGMSINWIIFPGGTGAIEAILSGDLQFAATGLTPFITLWSKSHGAVKGIAAMSAQPEYLNIRNPQVKSIRDLTEKDRIAVPAVKVSTQAVFLEMAAAKEWGEENHQKLDPLTTSLSQADAHAMLMSGRTEIDASFTSQPFTYEQLKDPKIHTILNTFDLLGGPATLTMVWTTKSFHDEHPKVYAAFLAAFNEAVALVDKDKRLAAEVYLRMSKDKLSVDEVVEILSDPQVRFDTTPQNTMKSVHFMHRIGRIPVEPASWKEMWFSNMHDRPGS